MVHWPGIVSPGSSNALISQVDIYASLASLLGIELNENEAMDSLDISEALLGITEVARDYIIEESVVTLSLRKGHWKYIVPTLDEKQKIAEWVATDKGIEGGFIKEPQLYNLQNDIGEKTNVANVHPEIVKEMQDKVDELAMTGFRKR